MYSIYFLGPENSYSHVLAKQVFKSDYSLKPCDNFNGIAKRTKKDGIGILPIENSITSDIYENMDILFKDNFIILGEAYLKINLHVIGNKKSKVQDITDIFSHPKALEQSSSYIQHHKIKTHKTSSTAKGKDYVKNNIHVALIGNKDLVSGNLSILESNIGNVKINMTRFVFLTIDKNITISKKRNKATIICTVLHVPGALAKVLNNVAVEGVNITKIESRPIPGTNWEYIFWIDIEKERLSFEKINHIFNRVTTFYKVLGLYDKGNLYES